jgi:hypothetical protein
MTKIEDEMHCVVERWGGGCVPRAEIGGFRASKVQPWFPDDRRGAPGGEPRKGSNLALAPRYVQNQRSMSSRLPQELLQELRTYVEHFDETGHLGESSTVAEIKRRLNQRIVEVEAQLRSMQSTGRESDRVAPDR